MSKIIYYQQYFSIFITFTALDISITAIASNTFDLLLLLPMLVLLLLLLLPSLILSILLLLLPLRLLLLPLLLKLQLIVLLPVAMLYHSYFTATAETGTH